MDSFTAISGNPFGYRHKIGCRKPESAAANTRNSLTGMEITSDARVKADLNPVYCVLAPLALARFGNAEDTNWVA